MRAAEKGAGPPSVLSSGLSPITVAVVAMGGTFVAVVLRRINVAPSIPIIASELLISSDHSLIRR